MEKQGMKATVKLSIIVPVYGVEKYIHNFLTSLEKNLQAGVEVLIINDGTKDKSAKIAEGFANNYRECVKVINKLNGGVSSARNKGLELAKGEYIIFADPDDLLAEDYISTIFKAINDYSNPDMIFFDYFMGSDEKGFKRKSVHAFKEGIVSKESYIREQIKNKDIVGAIWNIIVKKSLYNGLWFNESTRYGEDYEMMTDLSLRVDKIVYIQKPLYYYVMRENSITHTVTEKDYKIHWDQVLNRQYKYSKLYKGLSIYAPVRESLDLLLKSFKGEISDDISRYKEFINKNIKDIIMNAEFDLNEKKQCLLVFFNLAEIYYKIKIK